MTLCASLPLPRPLQADDHAIAWWAVMEHCRDWACFDGPVRAAVAAARGELDAALLRRIARKLHVNRGIRSGDGNAWALAERLNWCAAERWDGLDLPGRVEECIAAARWAEENGHTRGALVSAATKLMWFLRPEGWTMFDRVAAEAMGFWEGRVPDRARSYYRALHERGFAEFTGEANRILRRNGLGALHGERVVDRFLVLSAVEPRWISRVTGRTGDFLAAQPDETAQRYRRVADEIATRCLTPLRRLRDGA